MSRPADANPNEGQIRARIDGWAEAVRAKDLEALMSHYAQDIVVFDLAPPLQYDGAIAYRKNWADWFPSFQGPVGYEIRDLTIASSDDVAFCRSLNRISGTRTDGDDTDVWLRATVCFRRMGDQWMIVHEHFSVPINMETFKGELDLRP